MDLFGNEEPPKTNGKCDHLNAEYTLPCTASIKLRSTWEPGTDNCVETERKVSWYGGVQGKCLDCGKELWYTGSNMPKFIKRRLKRADVPEVQDAPYL